MVLQWLGKFLLWDLSRRLLGQNIDGGVWREILIWIRLIWIRPRVNDRWFLILEIDHRSIVSQPVSMCWWYASSLYYTNSKSIYMFMMWLPIALQTKWYFETNKQEAYLCESVISLVCREPREAETITIATFILNSTEVSDTVSIYLTNLAKYFCLVNWIPTNNPSAWSTISASSNTVGPITNRKPPSSNLRRSATPRPQNAQTISTKSAQLNRSAIMSSPTAQDWSTSLDTPKATTVHGLLFGGEGMQINTTTFPKFKELPVELRLKIVGLSFLKSTCLFELDKWQDTTRY